MKDSTRIMSRQIFSLKEEILNLKKDNEFLRSERSDLLEKIESLKNGN